MTLDRRTPLPSSEIKDGHVAAFGNREIALASLEDSLVLFNPPTLGFLDNVLGSTKALSAKLDSISLPFLVRQMFSFCRTVGHSRLSSHKDKSSMCDTGDARHRG
jgi:hypothetical protein